MPYTLFSILCGHRGRVIWRVGSQTQWHIVSFPAPSLVWVQRKKCWVTMETQCSESPRQAALSFRGLKLTGLEGVRRWDPEERGLFVSTLCFAFTLISATTTPIQESQKPSSPRKEKKGKLLWAAEVSMEIVLVLPIITIVTAVFAAVLPFNPRQYLMLLSVKTPFSMAAYLHTEINTT